MIDKDPAARLAEIEAWLKIPCTLSKPDALCSLCQSNYVKQADLLVEIARTALSDLAEMSKSRQAWMDDCLSERARVSELERELARERKLRDERETQLTAAQENGLNRTHELIVCEKERDAARADIESARLLYNDQVRQVREACAEAGRLRVLLLETRTGALKIGSDWMIQGRAMEKICDALSPGSTAKAVGTPAVRDTMLAKVPPTAAASEPGEDKFVQGCECACWQCTACYYRNKPAPAEPACHNPDCERLHPHKCDLPGCKECAPPSPPQSPPMEPTLTRITQAEAHCSKCARAYRILDAHGGIWARIEPKPGASL